MLLIPFPKTPFLRKLRSLSDSSETVDSRCSWVVVKRDHFWHRNSLFSGFNQGAQKRETGSIGSEGDLSGGSG